MINTTMPFCTRVEIEAESGQLTVFDRFPTDVLMRFSGLARSQLPISRIDWVRNTPVTVLTLPSTAADVKSLCYILHFLRVLPAESFGFPQIRSPGMFSFSEAALIYRTALQLRLPWDQQFLREQLLDYISENQLTVDEIALVWENYPRDSVIWKHMLERYVQSVHARAYKPMQKQKIKRYLRTQPRLLVALDHTVRLLQAKSSGATSKQAESHDGETKAQQRDYRVTHGLRSIDQEFLRRIRRESKPGVR